MDKPFQIDPSLFKTGNIIIDMAIAHEIKDLNKADWNKNGTPDISEYMALGCKLLSVLVALRSGIDFNELAKEFVDSKAVIDKELVHHSLLELNKLGDQASGLLPHNK